MNKLKLANLPTKIEKLERLSEKYNRNIYIKRDDYTGTEISGNKARKLDFLVGDARKKGCDVLVTAGAVQSNHCRATTAAAKIEGLDIALLIDDEKPQDYEGNLFLEYIMGADIHFVDGGFKEAKDNLIENLKAQGKKPYYIPVGGSSAVGNLGYSYALSEILQQEKNLSLEFDTIVVTVGSAGTYAGLWYGNEKLNAGKKVYGVSVSRSLEELQNVIDKHVNDLADLEGSDVKTGEYFITADYLGDGYAKTSKEDIDFIRDIAQLEGLILDPVYTGKTFKAMINELDKDLKDAKNILFIHTGGLYGWKKEFRELV